MPGALPVINKRAVELAIAAGLLCGCDIAHISMWDRKNYFYPDLAKAYQISQLYAPLCVGGGLRIDKRFIRLNRIHLEEDAGKLTHAHGTSHIDYNRAGVPLIEIVTEPDITHADEAVAFAEQVRQLLVHGGICDGKMQQGSLRVDANISLMPEGSTTLGTRAEIKNINSFRFLKAAILFEMERQAKILDKGGRVAQETRRYDEQSGETFSMRSKENAHDYRYFPDPDILPLFVTNEDIERIKNALPESPIARRERYVEIFGLSSKNADALLAERRIADFFDDTVKQGANPQAACNIIKGELMRVLNESKRDDIPITPADMAKALRMAADKQLAQEGLRAAVSYMFFNNCDIDTAVKANNLIVREDTSLVSSVISEVIAQQGDIVARYKKGEEKLIGFLVGQCMKKLKGKALPQTVDSLLKRRLKIIEPV
jgi:aspartyl-tRNA(Asn)/glutamyl-tRNA(Gln) amidotransferase subunit B